MPPRASYDRMRAPDLLCSAASPAGEGLLCAAWGCWAFIAGAETQRCCPRDSGGIQGENGCSEGSQVLVLLCAGLLGCGCCWLGCSHIGDASSEISFCPSALKSEKLSVGIWSQRGSWWL